VRKKILILGIGNEILMDDGIAPKLVKQLEREEFFFKKVVYLTACTGGLDILEFIQEYDKVIFIDAIKTKGGIAGNIYHLTPENFKETLHLSNLHDISFLHALELGRKLGIKIPGEIHIIAIEIVEDLVFGNEFTPLLQACYEDIYNSVKKYIRDLV
jgi:hydrogenase maturation protease